MNFSVSVVLCLALSPDMTPPRFFGMCSDKHINVLIDRSMLCCYYCYDAMTYSIKYLHYLMNGRFCFANVYFLFTLNNYVIVSMLL